MANHLCSLNGVFVLERAVKAGHGWYFGPFISVEFFAANFSGIKKNAKLFSISDNR